MHITRRFVPFARSPGGLELLALIAVMAACAHGDDPSPGAHVAGGSAGNSVAGSKGTGVGGALGSAGVVPVAGSSGEGGGDTAGSAGAGGDGGGSGSDLVVDSGSAGAETLDATLPDDSSDRSVTDVSDVVDATPIIETGSPLRPTGVTVSAQITPSQLELPSMGGVVFNDTCPANQVLIGFNGTIDAVVDGGQTLLRSVQGVCAPLTVTAAQPYQVKVGASSTLPMRWQVGVVSVSAMCPADQVIVGFGGVYAQFIQSLYFNCAPLVISGSSPSFTLSIGTVSMTNQIGAQSGTPFTAIACASNEVAVGQAPHAGADLDAFGVSCSPPSLVVQ